MCQLRTVVPPADLHVSHWNIFARYLTVETSRGRLSFNTVEKILQPVLTAASRMKGTSLVHTHREKMLSGPVRLLPLVCCLFTYGIISFLIERAYTIGEEPQLILNQLPKNGRL